MRAAVRISFSSVSDRNLTATAFAVAQALEATRLPLPFAPEYEAAHTTQHDDSRRFGEAAKLQRGRGRRQAVDAARSYPALTYDLDPDLGVLRDEVGAALVTATQSGAASGLGDLEDLFGLAGAGQSGGSSQAQTDEEAIAGTLIGGYIGGQVGRQMDDSDRYRAGQALEATPTNQSTSWRNPDSGTEYKVTPTRTYYDEQQPCREYTTEAWIDGKRETVYGTACRQTDGPWRAAN